MIAPAFQPGRPQTTKIVTVDQVGAVHVSAVLVAEDYLRQLRSIGPQARGDERRLIASKPHLKIVAFARTVVETPQYGDSAYF
jgi:hypothetical protein